MREGSGVRETVGDGALEAFEFGLFGGGEAWGGGGGAEGGGGGGGGVGAWRSRWCSCCCSCCDGCDGRGGDSSWWWRRPREEAEEVAGRGGRHFCFVLFVGDLAVVRWLMMAMYGCLFVCLFCSCKRSVDVVVAGMCTSVSGRDEDFGLEMVD